MAKKSKILVVYYTRTGNVGILAEKISKSLNADIEKIKTEDYSGFWGYLLGVLDIAFRRKPRISFTKNPADYNLIIIGSPIWSEGLAPPIKSYLVQNKGKIKKTAFFCSRGGGEIRKAIKKISKLASEPISVLNVLEKDIKENNYKAKLTSFIKEIK